MRVQQIRETGRLLRYGRKDNHSVQEADDHPANLVIRSRSGSIPSEQGEAGYADKESEGDEIEAELGLIGAMVLTRRPLCATVCQRTEHRKGKECTDGWESVQVAKLGRRVRCRRYREDLCNGDAQSAELWAVS